MKVTVCIGSSCHIKGSRIVVQTLNHLIETKGLKDKVELGGAFCVGNCKEKEGVCVKIGDEVHSVTPLMTKTFFENEISGKISAAAVV